MSLVSICAPLYNHEAYLEQCLQSLAEQDVDKELVVVDDCSTDGSYALAADLLGSVDLRGSFAGVKLLRNEHNMGAHYSLNRAAYEASGAFLTFVNTDDYYRPARLEGLMGAGAKLAFSYIDFAFADDVPRLERLYWSRLRERARGALTSSYPRSWPFLFWQHTFTTGNIFVARALFEELGGFRNLEYCHDWDFMLRAVLRAEPTVVEESSYVYRIHAHNAFRALEHVADAETDACMRSYLLSPASNPLACHPDNLPEPLLSSQIEGSPLLRVREQIVQRERREHRTVDFGNLTRLRLLRG